MEEIWKDVIGFEGYYQVSNLGNVRGIERYVKMPNGKKDRLIPEKYLPKRICNRGYNCVLLNKDRSSFNKVAHKLVAIAFIPNPENKSEVNHIDGVKTNNNVDNLEWVTPSENRLHAHKTGLIKSKQGEANPSCKLTDRDVRLIRSKGKYATYKKMADDYKIPPTTLSSILNNRTWKI